jgi:hypothetical protein
MWIEQKHREEKRVYTCISRMQVDPKEECVPCKFYTFFNPLSPYSTSNFFFNLKMKHMHL